MTLMYLFPHAIFIFLKKFQTFHIIIFKTVNFLEENSLNKLIILSKNEEFEKSFKLILIVSI